MDISFSNQEKSIKDLPEDIPERDEIEAIQQTMRDNSPKYTLDVVNWDQSVKGA